VADKGTGMFVQEAAIVLWMGGSGGWWVVGGGLRGLSLVWPGW
jgi:hypothetical protein